MQLQEKVFLYGNKAKAAAILPYARSVLRRLVEYTRKANLQVFTKHLKTQSGDYRIGIEINHATNHYALHLLGEVQGTTPHGGLIHTFSANHNRKHGYPAVVAKGRTKREWSPERSWTDSIDPEQPWNGNNPNPDIIELIKDYPWDSFVYKLDCRMFTSATGGPIGVGEPGTKYSGQMRKVVQKAHGYGYTAPFSPYMSICHGIFTPTSVPYYSRTGYWVIEINSSGMYAWPITFDNEDHLLPTDTKMQDLDATQAARYNFKIPEGYAIPSAVVTDKALLDGTNKLRIATSGDVSEYFSRKFIEATIGPAFSYSGHEIQHVVWDDEPDGQGENYKKMFRYKFSINVDGDGDPTSVTIAVVESGLFYARPFLISYGDSYFWYPSSGAGVHASFSPKSDDAVLLDSAEAPMYVYYDGDEEVVYRWKMKWAPDPDQILPGSFPKADMPNCGGWTADGAGKPNYSVGTSMTGTRLFRNDYTEGTYRGFTSPDEPVVEDDYKLDLRTWVYRQSNDVIASTGQLAGFCPSYTPYGQESPIDPAYPTYHTYTAPPTYAVYADETWEDRDHKRAQAIIIPFYEREGVYHLKVKLVRVTITQYRRRAGAVRGNTTFHYTNGPGTPPTANPFDESAYLDYSPGLTNNGGSAWTLLDSWIDTSLLHYDEIMRYYHGKKSDVVYENPTAGGHHKFTSASGVKLIAALNGVFQPGAYMAMKDSFRYYDRATNTNYPADGYDPSLGLRLHWVGDEFDGSVAP